MAGRVNDLLTGNGDLDSGFREGLNNNFRTLDLALDTEQQARLGGDSNLQAQITAEQQARLTQVQAHISAIAAHAAAAIALSPVTGLTATTVQAAVEQLRTMLTTIIAGPAPSAAEIQAARVGADGIVRASLDILIKEIHAKLIAANSQTATLKHGLNVVMADEAGPVALTIRGNSLTNILGDIGNGSKMAPGEPPANASKVLKTDDGNYAQYTAATAASDFGFTCNLGTRMDPTKYYLVVAETKKAGGSFTSAKVMLFTTSYSSQLKFSSIAAPSVWTKVFLKVSPSDMGANTSFRVAVTGAGGIVGDTINIRDVSVVEVDAATYAKIGVDSDYTGDNLFARYPYVDGVKHVTNPIVTKVSKNQLNGSPDYTHANATLIEPYKLTLIATASGQNSTMRVKVVAGQQYTVSATVTSTDGRVSIRQADAAGARTLVGHITATLGSLTFTASATTIEIEVDFNALNAGTIVFEKWQLEFGGKTQFEPQNNDYLYIPTTLAGYGGVQDVMTIRGLEATVLRKWKTGIALDGNLPWAFGTDYVGYKTLIINGFDTNAPSAGYCIVAKPNGGIAGTMVASGTADRIVIFTNTLYVNIADSESGWGEDYNPSATERSAYFFGWRMNNGSFGAAYNGTGTKTWTRWDATNNTGAVTVVPTTAVSGLTPYTLSYQFAAPVTEVVQVDGSLANHAGTNVYDVGEGVIIREKVTPTITGQSYFINASVTSKTSQRPSRILSVSKRGVPDIWNLRVRLEGDSGIPGSGSGYAWILSSFFDTTADYTVTYLAQDKYALTAPVVDVSMEYATSSKMVQDQLVQRMADVETVSTINVNAIAEMYRRLKALGG